MALHPYVFFEGRCEDALEFYKRALGAEVLMLMRFKDSPQSPDCPSSAVSPEKVMHARFSVGGSTVLASDGRCAGKPDFQGFALSLTVSDPAKAQKAFNALADGGRVQMPLGKTFFSPAFGMVADRFGVSWMVYVEGPKA
jgi:PhnB protein